MKKNRYEKKSNCKFDIYRQRNVRTIIIDP